MQFPSFNAIIIAAFVGYILNCIWTIGLLFIPPTCNDSEPCLQSSLSSQTDLMIVGFLSEKMKPQQILPSLQPVWIEKFFYKEQAEWTKTVPLTSHVRNNGSLYLHACVLKAALKPLRSSLTFAEVSSIPEKSCVRVKLTKFHTPAATTFNLLGSEETSGKVESEKSKKPIKDNAKVKKNHIQRRVSINMLDSVDKLPQFSIPPEMAHMFLLNARREYVPPIQYNFLSTRLRNLEEIKQNTASVNITLVYSPTTFGKMRFMVHLETSLRSLQHIGFSDKDVDDVKSIFEDTNLYLLGVTVFVASIHILFDFLALKNDIYFWKGRSNLSGLSGRAVMWRAFSQTVVFLYLLDEKTSLLVLVPAGLGTVLEMWKVQKVVSVKPVKTSWGIPSLSIELKGSSKNEELTKKLDAQAMRYLMYALYPLCAVGAVYSLLYQPHKGWYSWTINSLVNGVYAFGFLFMLPQLFINYHLKSVAHVPWRAFMYKAFNTFIDDLFAFVVSMPTAHRVACFRDDVVFLVYLYQRWLYPVDKSRLEGGSVSEVEDHTKPVESNVQNEGQPSKSGSKKTN